MALREEKKAKNPTFSFSIYIDYLIIISLWCPFNIYCISGKIRCELIYIYTSNLSAWLTGPFNEPKGIAEMGPHLLPLALKIRVSSECKCCSDLLTPSQPLHTPPQSHQSDSSSRCSLSPANSKPGQWPIPSTDFQLQIQTQLSGGRRRFSWFEDY